jgi:N-methyl-L-proline demethylase
MPGTETARSTDPLLQPFQLKHLTLRNRIFSSAHEPAYSEEGMPKERYRRYHAEKAKGGVAMTMTAGSAVVSPDSPPAFGNLHAYDDAIVPWIRELTDSVHEHGAACMIQLTHLGRRTGWGQDDWLPIVAPSAIREPAHRNIPKEAELWDIDRIVSEYADAAERMQAGGMDGVEIEASGHLFDQFWSPLTNHRDDEYGGSLENRMRFGLRVLQAIRARVDPSFIVGIRMAIDEARPDGIDEPVGVSMLERLHRDRLIDFVNVLRGNIFDDIALTDLIPIQGMASAPHLRFAGRVRARFTGLPVLHAAKIDDVATARHAIAEGLLDMVGMTRAQLADPHLVNKLASGRESEIRPCVGATYCLDRIYQAGEALCIHNAATSREATMPHVVARATVARRIVIVGAGPAGLEAGRVAAERGHEVTILEALPVPGGQIQLAARNQRRRDLLGIVEWRVAELHRLGAKLELGVFADDDVVSDREPDVVIIATGGWAQLPPLGAGSDLVSTTWDVMAGDVRPSGSVLLFDDNGTHSAMSAAEVIARSGAALEIVTPERTLGIEVGGMNMVPYARAFNECDVRVTLNQYVRGVVRRAEDKRLDVELGSEHSSHTTTRTVDHVIVDFGAAVNDELYRSLRPLSSNGGAVDYSALLAGRTQELRGATPNGRFQLFRIGDAVSNRNIHAAMYDALRLVKDL